VTVELTRSPLARRLEDLARIEATTGGDVVLAHVPFLAQVDLRLAPELATRAPSPLPLTPNTAWEDGSRAALWLGPDEWLILGPPGSQEDIVEELDRALAGLHRSIVDVSDNRVALELRGSGVKELLAKGCSLDLDARSWSVGNCAQTMLARAQVLLHERAETTGILVRPSFADYLLDWLLDAGTGWGAVR
jgi:sarcosine oxidase, subunit gamma